jgi:hypothetical protein
MPEEDLPPRITIEMESRANITQLSAPATILQSFPEAPTKDHIHIIVELTDGQWSLTYESR